jgi:uncharacterized protein (TIGR01777 family)
MKIAVTGASGLIGQALVASLRGGDHEVLTLVRRPSTGPHEVSWDPLAGTVGEGLDGIDAVVHLAGAGVGDKRWTDSYKREIRESRVRGTDTIARALATLSTPPEVLVSGSAIGYYPDSPLPVTEDSPPGSGFLSQVVVDWEGATQPAVDAGVRVVKARTGLVVSERGGAFQRLLPLFKYGLGGRIGDGHQYWSFISLRDEVRALTFAITNTDLSGPVNLVAPRAVTNREVTAALAEIVGRRAMLPVPGFALKVALGEFADDILGSQNVVPSRLKDAGYTWLAPGIAAALTDMDYA